MGTYHVVQPRGTGQFRRIAAPAPRQCAAICRPAVHDVPGSPVQPLARPFTKEMETHPGTDFSHVPIHAEAAAHSPAQGAEAGGGTSSEHMFQPDRYGPSSPAGARSLAEQNRSALTAHTRTLVDRTIGSAGAPLGQHTQARMEQAFGHDFSRVRVHTDAAAAASAEAVNAVAYTIGSHVAFARGAYAPDTSAGDRLLVHELAHVVQQGGREPPSTARLRVSPHDASAEREAAEAAASSTAWGHWSLSPGSLASATGNGTVAPMLQRNGGLEKLSGAELKEKIDAAMQAKDWTRFQELLDEEQRRAGTASRSTSPAPAEEKEEEEELPEGGLVTMKTRFPPDHPLHGLPGLQGPPVAFLASLDRDLHSDGIDPASHVPAIELWMPRPPGGTHYEVGAVVGDRYTKFDLTSGGYRLLHNADRPEVGDYFGSVQRTELTGVDARTLYRTFLEVAGRLGPFNMETNDCQRFAEGMSRQLKDPAASASSEESAFM